MGFTSRDDMTAATQSQTDIAAFVLGVGSGGRNQTADLGYDSAPGISHFGSSSHQLAVTEHLEVEPIDML